MRMLSLFGLFAVAAMGASTPALAHDGPPLTFTDTQHQVTETVRVEAPCGIGAGTNTITYNSVFHVTQFEDDHYHITGNLTAKFVFDPDDPGSPNSTGSFTTWFGENSNPGSFSATATSSVTARTDDGTLVRFTVTSHITIVGADVIVGFDKLNCG